jgi:hypothetical protein
MKVAKLSILAFLTLSLGVVACQKPASKAPSVNCDRDRIVKANDGFFGAGRQPSVLQITCAGKTYWLEMNVMRKAGLLDLDDAFKTDEQGKLLKQNGKPVFDIAKLRRRLTCTVNVTDIRKDKTLDYGSCTRTAEGKESVTREITATYVADPGRGRE